MITPTKSISQVSEWAKLDDRVVAVVLCGSHARGNTHPDSDIDFVIVSSEPHSLLTDQAWLDNFGKARVIGIEDWGLVQSYRVYYGEQEVEFSVAGLAWITPPIDAGTSQVLLDSIKILYDPKGLVPRAIADAKARHG